MLTGRRFTGRFLVKALHDVLEEWLVNDDFLKHIRRDIQALITSNFLLLSGAAGIHDDQKPICITMRVFFGLFSFSVMISVSRVWDIIPKSCPWLTCHVAVNDNGL